jgi:plastocyanin
VVRRELTHRRWARAAIVATLGGVMLLGAASAMAANHRVAIGNYQWSMPEIHLDRGEHVTWYWVGPDTMHSVTGTSPNAAGLDSDPGINTPNHSLGDTFQLSFNSSGTYEFQCRLHPSVRGNILVSSQPGDPNTEVDPVPRSNFDLTAPHVSEVELQSRRFDRHGTTLSFGVDETSKVEADYYAMRHGQRDDFAGWKRWGAHVGYNDVTFGGASKHFRPRPGRYEAVIRATDTSNNTARKKVRRFRIR